MDYQFVVNDQQLRSCCSAALQSPAVALDTEFVRTRTYYPQLGLIQLYDGEQISLIDPLTIQDWSPFIELLSAPSVMKYLHAGSEDLEVFLNRFSLIPEPMLDTQIMAAFLGHPSSLGFAAMVAHYSQVSLDKSESRTDWLARPLTEKQCQYAAADVAYLLPIAQQLFAKAQQQHCLKQIESECALHVRRRRQILAPEDAWLDITNVSQLRPRQLAALQLLAEWRLTTARRRNLAVNFVVKEEGLWKIARYLPTSLGELAALGLSGQEIRLHGEHLLALVGQAQQRPETDLPQPLKNLIEMPEYRSLFTRIKELVKKVANETGFSQELLASRRQINQLLSWHWQLKGQSPTPELLLGWRGELLAEPVEVLLRGR